MPPVFAKPQLPQDTHRAPEMPEPCPSPPGKSQADQTRHRAPATASSHAFAPPQQQPLGSRPGTHGAERAPSRGSSPDQDMLESAYAQLVHAHPYFTRNEQKHGVSSAAAPAPTTWRPSQPVHADTNGEAGVGNRAVVSSWWRQHQNSHHHHQPDAQRQQQQQRRNDSHSAAAAPAAAPPSTPAALEKDRQHEGKAVRNTMPPSSNAASGHVPPDTLPSHSSPRPPQQQQQQGGDWQPSAPRDTGGKEESGPKDLLAQVRRQRRITREEEEASKRESLLDKRRELFRAYTLPAPPVRRQRSTLASASNNNTNDSEGGHADTHAHPADTSIVACEVTSKPSAAHSERGGPPRPAPFSRLPRRTLDEEIALRRGDDGKHGSSSSSSGAHGKASGPQEAAVLPSQQQPPQQQQARSEGATESRATRERTRRQRAVRREREDADVAFVYTPIPAHPALAEGRELLKDIEDSFPLFRRHLTPPRPLPRDANRKAERQEKTVEHKTGLVQSILQQPSSAYPLRHAWVGKHAAAPCSSPPPPSSTPSAVEDSPVHPHAAAPTAASSRPVSPSTPASASSEWLTSWSTQQELRRAPRPLYADHPEDTYEEGASLLAYAADGKFAMSPAEFQAYVASRARRQRLGEAGGGVAATHPPGTSRPHLTRCVDASVGLAERRLREAMWRTRLLDPETGSCFALAPPGHERGAKPPPPPPPPPRAALDKLLQKQQPWPFQTTRDHVYRLLPCTEEAAPAPEAVQGEPRAQAPSPVGAAFADFCDAVRAAAAPRPLPRAILPEDTAASVTPYTVERSPSAWSARERDGDFSGFAAMTQERLQRCGNEADLSGVLGGSSFQPELAAAWGGGDPYYGPGSPSGMLTQQT